MSKKLETFVKTACKKVNDDPTRLMDIVRAVQEKFGCVGGDAVDLIAAEVKCHRVEVESCVSFYAFLSGKPKGAVVIRLCNDIVDEMNGVQKVAAAFSQELGIGVGETTPDGKITLEYTPCIGMCDQAPAALVNDVVVTNLDVDKAREIAASLKAEADPARLVHKLGDGNNAHDLVRAMVVNNIRQRGPVIFDAFESGTALRKAIAMSPQEVIRDIKTSRLRGRGGAGFPTGMKWDFARQAPGERRSIICNADEGEPGTFKDRVILTECPHLLFEGMAIAGYAVGAETGILYLRAEYAYLRAFLEDVLKQRRHSGLLGKSICGKPGFDFDVRIQMGAGAYICGEETALISSCEGKRGDPKTRPPFPAQKGYMDGPTAVNNVETLCCAARILDKGPGWFAQIGAHGSPGTKLLSISGDCTCPGVYEVPFGIKLSEVLRMAGAAKAAVVQIGGPSGQMVGPAQFERAVSYDDLATGGALTVFGKDRSVLAIAAKFMEFFVEESCGYCTPCRVGNVLIKKRVEQIIAGRGQPSDLAYLEELGTTVKFMSRCGLGQTSANPVLSAIKNFRPAFEAVMKKPKDVLLPTFDMKAALAEGQELAGRASAHF